MLRSNKTLHYITGQSLQIIQTHFITNMLQIFTIHIYKSGILPSSATAKPKLDWVSLIPSWYSHPPTSTNKTVWYNLLFFMFLKLHQIHMVCHSFLMVSLRWVWVLTIHNKPVLCCSWIDLIYLADLGMTRDMQY